MARGPVFKQLTIQRLRDIFDARGKSVAGVEKEMGLSRGFLGDAFRGEKRLSFETLLAILDHLGLDPTEFFRGPTEDERRRSLYPSSADEGAEVAEPPAPDSSAETHRAMMALIRVLEAKGILDSSDLRSVLATRKS